MKKQNVRLTADQDLINGRVGMWEKICYAAGEFGQNLFMMLGSTFGTLYFLEVGHMNEAILGALLIVCKLIDSLTDIGMGFLFDKVHPKFARKWKNGGTFRSWLAVMTPIAILAYVIMFNLPIHSGMIAIYACYILSQVLLGIGMSGVNITHGLIMPRMTQNPKERNTISMLMAVGVMMATMIVQFMVPMFLPNDNPKKPNYIPQGSPEYVAAAQHGFTMAVIILGVLFVISMVLAIVFTKERLHTSSIDKNESGTRSFKDTWHLVFTNKALVVMVIVGLCTTIGNTLVSSTQALWMKYYMCNIKLMGKLTMIGGFFIMPTVLLTPVFSNKFGKKNTYLFGLVMIAVFSCARFFVPQGNFLAAILTTVPGSIGTGLFMSIGASIGSDAQDYVEWKNGTRADGVMGSIHTFVTKIFGTVVPSIPLFVLGFTGYDGALPQQPASAVQGIHLLFSVVPGVLFLLAAFIFWKFYPLNKESHQQMMADLKASREAERAEKAAE